MGRRRQDELRGRLAEWLATREEVDHTAGVEVTAVARPESSGISSFSVLFDASRTSAAAGAADAAGSVSVSGVDTPNARRTAQLVARMCPPDDAFPVFPVYDLAW